MAGRLVRQPGVFARVKPMSAAEVTNTRKLLGLTQGEMASLLGLGRNTLSRWERGFGNQTPAMSLFVRLVRDVPAARDHLWNRP